ncbi:MAG: hypothetical protein PUQ00_22805 [Nostoc sp. S13]|nr:hypothetical protein [Nostoc sp. S13]
MPNTSLLRLRQRHRSVQVPNAQCPIPNTYLLLTFVRFSCWLL